MIWTRRPDAAALNALHEGTAVAALGIVVTAVGDDSLAASMPVDARTKQPAGLLHGGASVLLAETLGSAAAAHCVPEGSMAVGLEVNASHLRGVRGGTVHGIARALRVGRTAHVWEIRIADDDGAAVCVARLTVAVVPRPA